MGSKWKKLQPIEGEILERWKLIELDGVELKYKYMVSDCGRVVNSETGNEIKNRDDNGNHATVVGLIKKEGGRVMPTVARLVYTHFIGEVPDGYIVVKKDGTRFNHDARNLKLQKKSDFLSDRNRRRMRSVVKIDKDGNDVEVYKNSHEAGAKNYIYERSIRNRCNGLYKNACALDGYEYAWDDDDVSRREAYKRLGLDARKSKCYGGWNPKQ